MHPMNPPPLEIERTWLLSGLPVLPAESVTLRIEQGYLAETEGDAAVPADDPEAPLVVGRIRRTIRPDGTVEHVHTIKRGAGLVREEFERPIDAAAFEAAWPATAGRRLRKRRHRVPGAASAEVPGGPPLVWEIDEFLDLELVLAEVELPAPDLDPPIPPWLEPMIVREVTDDPGYTNAAIARRIGARTGRIDRIDRIGGDRVPRDGGGAEPA